MTAAIFNRKETLKQWKPMVPIQFSPEQINDYEKKIEAICILKGGDQPMSYLIELEGLRMEIDKDYVKYLARKHIVDILAHINEKGMVLDNIYDNIQQILKEIIDGTVDEDYYTNTIDIYDSINGSACAEIDLYGVINQAIRLDNKRLLYYMIFEQIDDIMDRAYEVIREEP